MFAVIYQSYLKPGREDDYKSAWHQIASYFVEKRGALGSCLHRTDDGKWIAYSRWPDKATRDASWPGENAPSHELPAEIRQAILTIKECMDQDRKIPDICMDMVSDLLH
ncbi:MAG TPA: antibiotic biosynthesis monooxygenase [Rhabdochlamydiaceae bacterium]|nr:antibiotic biosynthesis monooxygenase [Rhabdochlamydiaceae bacterium]